MRSYVSSLFLTCLFGLSPIALLGQESYVVEGNTGSFYTKAQSYGNQNIDGYNLYVPYSSKNSDKAYPILVFLQGGLGVGGEVDIIFNWGLPKMLIETKRIATELDRYRADTFLVVMPHISNGQFYNSPQAIQSIIKEVAETHNGDLDRVYLTGLSRGGHGTWGLADDLTDTFAAIAPLAGSSSGIEDYQALVGLPIWVSHNTGDRRVNFNGSSRTVASIEERADYSFYKTTQVKGVAFKNYDYIFTAAESDSHDSWTEFYSSPEIYKWFLKYSKE